MTENHPITPSPELVQQWRDLPEYTDGQQKVIMITLSREKFLDIAIQAARWGADQELEACCVELAWLASTSTARYLRERRRPKPPSLVEQALKALQDQIDTSFKISSEAQERANTIRAALERLKELEQSND